MEGQKHTESERIFYFGEKKHNGSTEYTPVKCTESDFKSFKESGLTSKEIESLKNDKLKFVKQGLTVKK